MSIVAFEQSRSHGRQEYGFRANQLRRRRAARRTVKAGFPVEKPFTCIEDVEAYLAAKRIACLLCGNLFSGLTAHLVAIHDITAEQYKVRYNIPPSLGLLCPESFEKYSAHSSRIAAKNRDDILLRLKSGRELMKQLKPAHRKSMLSERASAANLLKATEANTNRHTPPLPLGTIECAVCGTSVKTRSARRFCSHVCYTQALRAAPACKRGHEFTVINTYWTKFGRSCRECRNMAAKKFRAQRVALERAP
jgi:predicted transcriptional regulator